MTTLFDRLKKAFPFLGERAATEEDLFDLCARRGVEIIWAAEITRGIYVRRAGRDHIFLNSTLHGISLLYVLAHEVAHMLLHVPTKTRDSGFMAFAGNLCRRNHLEAETAAALLLIPRHAVTLDAQDDERMAELMSLRLRHLIEHHA